MTFLLLAAMMKKKAPKILQDILIERIGYGGVGIAKHADGRKILVSGGVLPGMKAAITVTKQKKDYTEGRLYHVQSYDSSFTLNPEAVRCPHYVFNTQDGLTHEGMGEHKIGCGGCKWQILTYEKQLMLKQQIVTDSFRHLKDVVEKIGMKPFVPAPEVFNYRNKIEYSFGKYITNEGNDNQHRQLGFHKQGQFSKVIDVDQCYLVSDEATKLYRTLKSMLMASGLPVHDSKTHLGFLRHLVVREGRNTGNFLVNLSVAEAQLAELGMGEKWEEVKKNLSVDEYLTKTITSFVITVNNGLADVVNGQDIHTYALWGEGHMYEKLIFNSQSTDHKAQSNIENPEGIIEASFRVSPFSFFQTNTLGAQRLFQTAMDAVGKIDGHILDLYCGTGSIGISFLKAGMGDKVFGIEIVPDAIVDAVRNAKINGLAEQTYFVAGKAEDLISRDEYIAQHLEKMQLVIVDPPRDGLHKTVVEFLLNLKKNNDFTLLYISCNPVTMARDIALLAGEQYALQSLQPVDMFPHTHHVEMVGVLR